MYFISTKEGRGYAYVLLIGLGIIVLQYAGSVLSGSLSLLGDTFHVGLDTLSYMVAIIAISRRNPEKAKRIGARINASLLCLAGIWLFCHGFLRAVHPHQVLGSWVTGIATAGALGNGAQLLILQRYQGGGLLGQSVMAHVASDLAQSMAVILSGLAQFLPWSQEMRNMVDPFLSGGIGFAMAIAGYRILISKEEHRHH